MVKGTGLVAVGIFALFIIIAVLLVIPSNSDAQTVGFRVDWELLVDGMTHKKYKVTVQNLNLDTHKFFNLTLIIDNTNFPIDQIKNIKMYEQVNMSYNVTIIDFDTVTKEYKKSFNHSLPSGCWDVNITHYGCYEKIESGNHQETRYKIGFESAKEQFFKQTSNSVRKNIGRINIPKLGAKDLDSGTTNGTKVFIVEFDVPITEINGVWGSVGRVGFFEEDSQVLYHPWFDTLWLKRRQITVNNTASGTVTENYTINLTMNTTGDSFLDSGDDVRIVYDDGVATELDRKNMTPFNSETTEIFFKLNKSIESGQSDSNYYVYYNNSAAGTPPENGSKVFIYFQDFNGLETGALSGQDLWDNPPGATDDNFSVVESPNSLEGAKMVTMSASSGDRKITRLVFNLKNLSFTGYMLSDNLESAGGKPDIILRNETDDIVRLSLAIAANQVGFEDSTGNVNMVSFQQNISYRFDVDINHLGKMNITLLNASNTSQQILATSSNRNTINLGSGVTNITMWYRDQGGIHPSKERWDWFTYREFVFPEPNITLGPEILQPPRVIITSPLNKTYDTSTIELNFTITISPSEELAWCAFSLNGGANDTSILKQQGDFANDTFDTAASGNANPHGITQNGTYFWIPDSIRERVYKYYMNGTYAEETFDTAASGNADPDGITQNGTYFWIVDSTDNLVYKYYMNGTYANDTFDTAASGNADPRGITQNGTYFWIVDFTDKLVYKYYMNGTYANDTFDAAASGNASSRVVAPRGITQDGTYFWITDIIRERVYKYYMNGTYANDTFDAVAIGTGSLRGITQNGTYFWLVDSIDDLVYKYHFVTACVNTIINAQEGFNNITIWANDTAGNMNRSDYVFFTVDTTPPNITFVSPTPDNDSIQINDFITINVSVEDIISSVDVCTLEFDGVNETMNKTGSGSSINCSATKISSVGTHTFRVYANDTQGNINRSELRTYRENVEPIAGGVVITHDLREYLSVLRGSNITIKFNATDSDGAWDIDVATINITGPDGNLRVNNDIMTNTTSITNGYVFEFNYTILVNASTGINWSINITVNDTSGQQTSNSTIFSVQKVTITTGDIIQLSGIKMNETPFLKKTDGIKNPLTDFYTNFQVNNSATTDTIDLLNLSNSTTDVRFDSKDLKDGSFIFTIERIGAQEEQSWTIEFNITRIKFTEINTTDGADTVFFINITKNVTNLDNVVAFKNLTANFSEISLFSLISGSFVDVTNNPDFDFEKLDTNNDNNVDFVQWVIKFLNENKQFKIVGTPGTTIIIEENITILNPPVTQSKNIEWKNLITFTNPNPESVDFAQKIRPPSDGFNFILGGLSIEPQFDSLGLYISIVVIIDGDSSTTRTLTYKTDAITSNIRYNYPSVFKANEKADIFLNISLKNQAQTAITGIEEAIFLDYGEDIFLCNGFIGTDCIKGESIDSEKIVNGNFLIEIKSLGAAQSKNFTLAYKIHTVEFTSLTPHKESIFGILQKITPFEAQSISPIPLFVVEAELTEFNCEKILNITDSEQKEVFDFDCNGTITTISLGSFDLNTLKQGIVFEKEVSTDFSATIERIVEFLDRELYDFGFVVPLIGQFFRIRHFLIIIGIIIISIVIIKFDLTSKASKRLRGVSIKDVDLDYRPRKLKSSDDEIETEKKSEPESKEKAVSEDENNK